MTPSSPNFIFWKTKDHYVITPDNIEEFLL